MNRPMAPNTALFLATITLIVACAAIVALAVLVVDGVAFGVFLPLFAPAGLASWAIYRSGVHPDPTTE